MAEVSKDAFVSEEYSSSSSSMLSLRASLRRICYTGTWVPFVRCGNGKFTAASTAFAVLGCADTIRLSCHRLVARETTGDRGSVIPDHIAV
jgi:hypothetical protein